MPFRLRVNFGPQLFARLQAETGLFNLTGITADLSNVGGWDTLFPIPDKQFVFGTSSTYDLVQHTLQFNPSLHQFSQLTGTQPSGVTLLPTSGLSYDGVGPVASATGLSYRIVDNPVADWIARSTAGGVIMANRLETAFNTNISSTPPVSLEVSKNDQPSQVVLDTAVKVAGAIGSTRMDVGANDGASSGNLRCYFGSVQTFGNGSTLWYSFRVRAPASHVYQRWLGAGSGLGNKLSIMSDWQSSNQVNEVVFENDGFSGIFNGYWQDGLVTAVNVQTAAVTPCSATDFRYQPEIDQGSNTLTGTNPDTGAAWTACEQARRQYGLLYSARQSAVNFAEGFGDPLVNTFRQVPDEWITLIARITIGTFGTTSSRWTVWAARDGVAPVKLWDKQSIRLGSGPAFNTLWLLPYMTNRTAGGRKVGSRTNNIGGAEILTVSNAAPVGNGTLEYNATTQRFRWLGNGESFGSERGFSVANDILTINVIGATVASYIVVKVTPGSLPTSGTVTDTITIANGRADTQIYYNDLIVSTQIINAPGGYPPVG
jgi:hypothetical protein